MCIRDSRQDGGDLDQRDIQMPEKTEPDELRDVAEVDVDIFHRSGIDALARDRIGLVGQAQFEPLTLASAPSSSGAVEAPVQTPIRNGSPRACTSSIRCASASGTVFGYPDPVKPLMPTFAPCSTKAAASSADMIFERR